jgi:hypothetical protein
MGFHELFAQAGLEPRSSDPLDFSLPSS